MTYGRVAFAFCVALRAGTAIAQPVAADGGEQAAPPVEIVVTGERITRSLRETPSSVVVIDATAIDATGAARLDDLLVLIPNVQLGSGEEGPAIRGQDSTGLLRNLFAFLGGTRPRVTLQLDGRAASYAEFVSGSEPAWDIDRIEVFRSPQTTTSGRNAIAGAIVVASAQPVWDWEGRARLIAGSFDTRQVSATVSGPVVADRLAFRLAGDLRFATAASDMADGIAGADIDRDDYGMLRARILFQPAQTGLRIDGTYVHNASQSPQFEGVARPFPERELPVPNRMIGVMKINTDSITARTEYDAGSGWRAIAILSHGDVLARRFGLPGLGNTRAGTRDYSAELNLIWQAGDRLDLRAGSHGLATRQDQFIDITGLGIGTGEFRDRQESLGLFAEAGWRPWPRLLLTGGLRYQTDRQRRDGAAGPLVLDYDGRFDAWLPKLSLAYDIGAVVTAGVMVQRAYNPGGTSLSLLQRAQDDFGAERLWNFETFFRASLGGGTGAITANLFYNDISDAQRELLVPFGLPDGGIILLPEFSNAPAAESYGLEAGAEWQAARGLNLRGGLGWLETRIVRTLSPNDPILGQSFERAPRFSASGAVDWRAADAIRLSAQARYHSGYFSGDANLPSRRIKAAAFVDARGEYRTGRAAIFAYARNLLDNFAMTYLFDPDFGTAADPREIGLGFEMRL